MHLVVEAIIAVEHSFLIHRDRNSPQVTSTCDGIQEADARRIVRREVAVVLEVVAVAAEAVYQVFVVHTLSCPSSLIHAHK